MQNRNDQPNLLGAAIFAFVLGAIMLGLSVHAKLTGNEVDMNAVLMGGCLLALGALAVEKHKELKAMTPEARARYWAAKQKSWEAAADSHARAMLGDDHDKKRTPPSTRIGGNR